MNLKKIMSLYYLKAPEGIFDQFLLLNRVLCVSLRQIDDTSFAGIPIRTNKKLHSTQYGFRPELI